MPSFILISFINELLENVSAYSELGDNVEKQIGTPNTLKDFKHNPEYVCQILQNPSHELLKMKEASLLKHTPETGLECPLIILKHSPLVVSHILIDSS